MKQTASEIIVNVLRTKFPEMPKQDLQQMALDIQIKGRVSGTYSKDRARRPAPKKRD